MNNLNSNIFGNGSSLPLLMNYTPSTKIQEETNPISFIYSDEKQVVVYDMRTVGTKSLKSSRTKVKIMTEITDKKNEIDDSKNVK
jgi:hypothetical protein